MIWQACRGTGRAERACARQGGLPHRLGAALQNDAQIIGGHWYGLRQGETVTVRQIRDLGEVPYAPLSVLRSQPNVLHPLKRS
jgi:hypothetical protein